LEISPAQSEAAIEQGRIDGATILEPTLTQAIGTGKVRVFAYPYGAIAAHFDGADWFTTTDFAAKHHDVVERFARVMHDANAYVASHETETIPLIASYTGIDAATLAGMKHPERPAYLDPASIQPLIEAAVKYNFIPQRFPAQEMISEYALKAPRPAGN
jgi:ABC-type nitrate/sulfonate/bicarbonate transport system substrate-binding protein